MYEGSLRGRTALVTGGASGIGFACACELVRAGALVVIADRALERAEAVGKELAAIVVPMDVADERSVVAGCATAVEGAGEIDILIHSAGILQRALPPGELTIEEWDRVQGVNLRGAYLVNRTVGNAMARRGRGSIVNIASVAGVVTGPLLSYSPAKAGLISLTQCLAVEWGGAGVRVNAVSPGFTVTPALDKGLSQGVLKEDQLRASTALDRLVEAEEVARAACFLASDLASAITGINLPVDAGYLAATSWHAYGGPRRWTEPST